MPKYFLTFHIYSWRFTYTRVLQSKKKKLTQNHSTITWKDLIEKEEVKWQKNKKALEDEQCILQCSVFAWTI